MTYLGMRITDNSNNHGFCSNKDYDKLIANRTTGAYVSDYDARWSAMYEAKALVMEEAVIAPPEPATSDTLCFSWSTRDDASMPSR